MLFFSSLSNPSLHGHLATVAAEDLISHDDFLGASPPVFMTPLVAPVQEVGHWEHGDSESADKWLSSNDWEEHEGGS